MANKILILEQARDRVEKARASHPSRRLVSEDLKLIEGLANYIEVLIASTSLLNELLIEHKLTIKKLQK